MTGSRSARVTNPTTGDVKRSAKGKKELRSFVCVSVNGKEQPYSQTLSTTPNSGASKHFQSWCKENKKGAGTKAVVEVRESTRGSLQKKYAYTCSRVKLGKPENVGEGDEKRTYRFKNVCLKKN